MKTLNTFKKVVTTRYQTEIIEVSPEVLLIVHKSNSRVTSEIFVLKKDCKINKKKGTYEIKKGKKEVWRENWEYFAPHILDEIKTKHMTHINTKPFKLSPYKVLKKNGKLNVKQILWFNYGYHSVFRLGQESPVSGVFVFDYIGGVNNRDFHINKAYEHLKKHKEVLEVRLEDIPYYNRENDYTKGLHIEACVSQAKMNKIWNEVKKHEYATCRIKDVFIPASWRKYKTDPLGLKKFAKTEKEI